MKTLEEYLELEIEEFESAENMAEFEQLSVNRRNNILFKRLLFDYDEDLESDLNKFISSDGKEPAWAELIISFPELKYIVANPPDARSVVNIVLEEITLNS